MVKGIDRMMCPTHQYNNTSVMLQGHMQREGGLTGFSSTHPPN